MRPVIALGFGVLLVSPLSAVSATPDPAASAKAWVSLIDQGRYGESWSASGAIFRGHISKAKWATMVAQVRGPLGAVVSRTFVGNEPAASLPGVPDGSYDQIHFGTVFAHKQSAIETVVLAREPGGWRVDGYWIR